MPSDNVVKLLRQVPCPVCGKPSSQQFHPFCSARCKDIDLNRWLSDGYVIPGTKLEEDEAPVTGGEEDGDDL
jgi:endogenous inhibitor of DNA gyrase (YacG/DUF329 family)